MNKKLFSLFVEVESHQFWTDRPILKRRMRQLYKYIRNLKAENDQLHRQKGELERYTEYVDSRISEGEMPWLFQIWLQAVNELAKELEQVVSATTKRQILKEHRIEYSD